MSDLYNLRECQRCGKRKGAPWETEPCRFEIGGWERLLHLCLDCRQAVIPLVKKALKQLEGSVSARQEDDNE